MGDLLPGRIAVQQDEVDAVDITPLTSETKYQRVRPLIRLLAGEAVAVKAWGQFASSRPRRQTHRFSRGRPVWTIQRV